MIILPKEVSFALNMLCSNGFEAYIVGGCVRDSLMSLKPKDYDITTSALPEETKKIFKEFNLIETGIKHGTVTVIIDGIPLEITTYRVDSDYSDNRHPDSVNFTRSLKEDASRRDFTMNAIAYSDSDGIKDFFNGQADIQNGIIRCVGDADKRFNEDALRIMRTLRFASVLGFSVEDNTKKAIFKNKALLLNISAERLASELSKLLCGKDAGKILTEYIDVLGVIIPELLPMKGFNQHNCHHIYDVLEHTAQVVDNIPPSVDLRLSALFHDIGKPPCFALSEDGVGHFYGHAKISAQLSLEIMTRLKYDNQTKDVVCTLVKAHDVQIENTEKAVKRALNKYTPEIFSKLILLKRADNFGQNPEYRFRQNGYDALEKTAQKILSEKQCFSLKNLAVNGNDLIKLGIKPGPEMGNILNMLLEKVINDELTNDKQRISEYIADNKDNYR